jgi:predicted GNAT superfamily acetyltransferase
VQRTEPVATDATPVTYRLLHDLAELAEAAAVVCEVWDDPALATASLLRAYTHFGNPTLGAVDAEGRIVGVSVGFLAPAGGVHLHSHITGVLPGHQHLGIGHGLKLAQRRWCLDHDIPEITWTFDPMLARNAHFNLRKLGAVVEAVLPAFYGRMDDAVNRGEVTDRLEAHWYLDDRPSASSPVDVARTVAIPADYARLRTTEPARAEQERSRVRSELVDAFADGLVAVDFRADTAEYVFTRR